MKTIYLLVKTHSTTGLKYLCQTTRRDYEKYPGSGLYWKKHLVKHGTQHTTQVVRECANREEIIHWGQYYSNLWNVVNSSEWANLRPEEGSGNTSERARELWLNPVFRKKKAESFSKTSATNEYKQQQSISGKKVWSDLEYRASRPDQSGTNNPNYDSTPYTFIDKHGLEFLGSKWEFAKEYNLRTKAVRHLVKGDVQTHKGWKLVKTNIDDHRQHS
jgi:hypothetical protein